MFVSGLDWWPYLALDPSTVTCCSRLGLERKEATCEEQHGPPRRVIQEKRYDGESLEGVKIVGDVAQETHACGGEEDTTTGSTALARDNASSQSEHCGNDQTG